MDEVRSASIEDQRVICMSLAFRDKKEPAPYVVGTAKMPSWLFERLESFRDDSGILTRSATINILVALGLFEKGYVTAEEFQNLLYSLGINARPIERVSL